MSELGEDLAGVMEVAELFRPEPGSLPPSERARRARAHGDRVVAALKVYVPAAVLAVGGIEVAALGPRFEEAVAPVRVNQSVHDVSRKGDRLCWSWESDKVRARVSDNIDVFVDIVGLPGAASAIAEEVTGMPWVRSRAVPLGHHVQRYCLTLPPYVTAATPVRVRQVAWYPGFVGLWHVAVHIPDVVDPAGSVIP